MTKKNMVSTKNERNMKEELITDYYNSIYGDKKDTIKLRKKAKSEKLSKLKSKFSKKRLTKKKR